MAEKPISPESKGYGNLGRGNPKDLAKARGNEGLEWARDAQGSPKQHEYKLNDSTGLLELSKRKAYNKLKRGPTSTSQIITWHEQRGGMVGVLIDP